MSKKDSSHLQLVPQPKHSHTISLTREEWVVFWLTMRFGLLEVTNNNVDPKILNAIEDQINPICNAELKLINE